MNVQRLKQELDALSEEYTVYAAADGSVIDLDNVRYPSYWRPQTSMVRFALPPNYPESPPTVHVPDSQAYKGKLNINRMKPSQFHGWYRWCVRFNEWDDNRHTLVTVTRAIMDSLSDPAKRRLSLS